MCFSADNDPHFIVKVKGNDDPVCFDVMGKIGDIFQLIHDAKQGMASVDTSIISLIYHQCMIPEE